MGKVASRDARSNRDGDPGRGHSLMAAPSMRVLQDLVDYCPYALAFTGPELGIQHANPAFTRLLLEGSPPRPSIVEYFDKPSRPRLMEAFDRAKNWGAVQDVYAARSARRRRFDADVTVSRAGPVSRHDGFVVVVTDITAKLDVERSRRLLQERIELAFGCSNDGFWDYDVSSDRIFFSQRFRALLGLDGARLAPTLHEWRRRVHPDDRTAFDQAMNRLRREPDAKVSLEHRLKRRDSGYRWMAVKGASRVNASGSVDRIAGAMTDITEQRDASVALANRQAEVAHLQRLHGMGEMAAMLAHEINQPLAVIANFANGLRAIETSDAFFQERVRDAVAEIASEALRAGEIIRRIRDFIRKRPSLREPASINEVVSEAIELVKELAMQQNARILKRLSPAALVVDGDRVQILQVVFNLLSNAIDAMAEQDGERIVRVETGISHRPKGVVVTVSDTGPGLSRDARRQAFEPFYTTKAHGLGMGLSISRRIIADHGGKLVARSNRTRRGGATFRFFLPARQGGEADVWPMNSAE